MPNEPHQWCNG